MPQLSPMKRTRILAAASSLCIAGIIIILAALLISNTRTAPPDPPRVIKKVVSDPKGPSTNQNTPSSPNPINSDSANQVKVPIVERSQTLEMLLKSALDSLVLAIPSKGPFISIDDHACHPNTEALTALLSALSEAQPDQVRAFLSDYLMKLQSWDDLTQTVGGSLRPHFLANYIIAKSVLQLALRRNLGEERELSQIAFLLLSAPDRRSHIMGALIPSVYKLPNVAESMAQEAKQLSSREGDLLDYDARHQVAAAIGTSGNISHASILVDMALAHDDVPSVGPSLFALGKLSEVMPHFLRMSRDLDRENQPLDEIAFRNVILESVLKGRGTPAEIFALFEKESHEPTRHFLFDAWMYLPAGTDLDHQQKSDYALRVCRESNDPGFVNSGFSYLITKGIPEARIQALQLSGAKEDPGTFHQRILVAWQPTNAGVRERMIAFVGGLSDMQKEGFVAHVERRLQARAETVKNTRPSDLLDAIRRNTQNESMKDRIEVLLDRLRVN